MTLSKTVVVDDPQDALPIIDGVELGPAHISKNSYGDDKFLEPAKVIKSYAGLSAVTKRRISNQLKKVSTGVGDATSKKTEIEDMSGYDAFEVIQPPYNLDYLAALYEVSPPHYAAVKAKTSNIVGLGFDLIESPKMKRRLEELSEDQAGLDKLRRKMARGKDLILDRIDKMNSDDTFIEVLTKVWTDYEVTGNGYIEVGRTTAGEIGYIGHIPSTTMRVRRTRDGFIQIISSRVVYFRNFGADTPDPIGHDSRPNEVIHIKKYAPSSTYYGIPDVVAAKASIAGNDFAARYNLDYFENKAVPRHVIILKGAELSGTAQASILEFFETGLKGKNHRSLYIPLPGDTLERKVELSIEPVEAGVQESSFEKYRATNTQEILMAHRVPISKVGTPTGVSLANARDADKTFSEQVCQPEQKIAEKKVGKIISELTDAFLLKFNEMSLTDAMTQANIDQMYVRNDVFEPNEVRATKGMPGRPGGDTTVGMYAQAELAGHISIETTQMSNDTAIEQSKMSAQQAAAAAAAKPKTAKPAKGKGPSQAASNNRATANQSRVRDTTRSAVSPDKQGESRNPKGDGRQAK